MFLEQMMNDDNEIEAIHLDSAQWSFYVGKNGVTRVEVYGEPGHMAMIPFVAVLQNDFVWQRIPANLCRIQYKSPTMGQGRVAPTSAECPHCKIVFKVTVPK